MEGIKYSFTGEDQLRLDFSIDKETGSLHVSKMEIPHEEAKKLLELLQKDLGTFEEKRPVKSYDLGFGIRIVWE